MMLLIVMSAAFITTLLWYINPKREQWKLGTLCLMFWGASLMWLVDAVTEYLEIGDAYFNPTVSEMLNDAFLGISVVIFALLIWMVMILKQDPKGVFHKK